MYVCIDLPKYSTFMQPQFIIIARLVSSRLDLYKLWLPEASEDPEYVGCYADDKSERVLSDMITTDGMTPAVCHDHCLDKDTPYYATQVSHLCGYDAM